MKPRCKYNYDTNTWSLLNTSTYKDIERLEGQIKILNSMNPCIITPSFLRLGSHKIWFKEEYGE